jgi:hypothetical protein
LHYSGRVDRAVFRQFDQGAAQVRRFAHVQQQPLLAMDHLHRLVYILQESYLIAARSSE